MNREKLLSESRIQAAQEWKSILTCLAVGLLVYESLSGLSIYLLPFSVFNQFEVLLHSIIGIAALLPVIGYGIRHWWLRRGGNLNHYQLLGYFSILTLFICVVSGLMVAYQAAFTARMSPIWDFTHLLSGIGFTLFMVIHIGMLAVKPLSQRESQAALAISRNLFYKRSLLFCSLGIVMGVLLTFSYRNSPVYTSFSEDYNWKFGEDRPFAPSLARLDNQQWQEPLLREVLLEIPQEKHPHFLAAYERQKAEPIGVFAKMRESAAENDLDQSVCEKLEETFSKYAQIARKQGALPTGTLANSAGCGTVGCHEEIYQEWLPSAHRYASLDHMFQKVQEIMAVETSPEHTRYCAGCHDPISLFNGAKNSNSITLSAEGADEGVSCLVCHTIVQADTQGNADYTIQPPEFYLYERGESKLAKFTSDFLIRAYPKHHVHSYSRELYKSAEYCGACHKQYIDREVNTDIGRVQGQNQYDSWRTSRWNANDDPQLNISCRECHMPLIASRDPSAGDPLDYNRSSDDGQHRGHRFLGANQYIPIDHDLPYAEEHVRLTEQWLRGEIEVPEIAEKWASGPVVQLEILAPDSVSPGDTFQIQILLNNNKTGHDFPTGPLDMIEAWLEVKVQDTEGRVLYHSGVMDDRGAVLESPVIFKSDGVDRKGDFIDRHNLWDLVGAKYKRALFAGFTDTVNLDLLCPSTAVSKKPVSEQRMSRQEISVPNQLSGKQLQVTAVLWYRKANTAFLDRIYGVDAGVRAPITDISQAERSVQVISDESSS